MQKKKIIAIVAIVVIIACIAAVLLQPGSVQIYIHGVPVSGLNAEEAEAVLMERFQPGLGSQVIKYFVNGEMVAQFTFADFGARYDFSELVQTAVDFTSVRSFPQKLQQLLGRPYQINDAVAIVTSPQRTESIFADIAKLVNRAATDATFIVEDGRIVVKPESAGSGIDMQAAIRATEMVLQGLESGVVELEIVKITPQYTVADFTFHVSSLGSFATRYVDDGNDPRVYNVRLAAQRINNQVLHPGQVFSAGELIAAHKPNSGYKSAIVLVGGEPVEDTGGGVCQVVTTLYNAVLAAELQVTQRNNHSAPVSYVERGFDATVAGDYYDLKFKNNTPHPILVSATMNGGELRITIYGYESRPADRSIRFSARRIEIIPPGPYREVVDPTVPRGERHIVLESQMGYHVELFKHVYMAGKEVEVIKINTSVYKALPGVVAIGAG